MKMASCILAAVLAAFAVLPALGGEPSQEVLVTYALPSECYGLAPVSRVFVLSMGEANGPLLYSPILHRSIGIYGVGIMAWRQYGVRLSTGEVLAADYYRGTYIGAWRSPSDIAYLNRWGLPIPGTYDYYYQYRFLNPPPGSSDYAYLYRWACPVPGTYEYRYQNRWTNPEPPTTDYTYLKRWTDPAPGTTDAKYLDRWTNPAPGTPDAIYMDRWTDPAPGTREYYYQHRFDSPPRGSRSSVDPPIPAARIIPASYAIGPPYYYGDYYNGHDYGEQQRHDELNDGDKWFADQHYSGSTNQMTGILTEPAAIAVRVAPSPVRDLSEISGPPSGRGGGAPVIY